MTRTKSQILKILVSFCSCHCPMHWSQALSPEWRCSWSSGDGLCSNYIWVINKFIAYWSASYITGFTVFELWLSHQLRWLLGALYAPSKQLNWCWSNIYGTKWNRIQLRSCPISNDFFQEVAFEVVVCRTGTNLTGGDISWYIEAETKWPPFYKRHFHIHFPVRKLLYIGSKFTGIWCQVSNE